MSQAQNAWNPEQAAAGRLGLHRVKGSGEANGRADDDDGSFVELDVLATAGSLHAAPDALGIARPCMARLVGAPIRLGAVQGIRGSVGVVDDRDMARRPRFLAARVHPEDDVVLLNVVEVPDEHVGHAGPLVLSGGGQEPRTADATRVGWFVDGQLVDVIVIGYGEPGTVDTEVRIRPLLGAGLQLVEMP